MAVVNFESFFGFGASSGTSDGFPPIPGGSSLESTGHVRFYPIPNSVDSLRLPSVSFGSGVTNLGYRRQDATGSGGASEWLIDWNAVATFTGKDAVTLSSGSWHKSVIKDGKIYIGFRDGGNAIGNGPFSYLLTADLTTGSIESVTYINNTNVTADLEAQVEVAMNGTSNASAAWDISPSNTLRMAFNTSGLGGFARNGMAYIEMNLDGVTVIDEQVYFPYTSAFGADFSFGQINYFTEDLSIFVGGPEDQKYLVIPGHGVIMIKSDNSESPNMMGANSIIAQLTSVFVGTENTLTHISDDAVHLRREMVGDTARNNAVANVTRSEIKKTLIDTLLKEYVFNYAGVQL